MTRSVLFALTLCLALPSLSRAETAADVIDRMKDAEAGYYAGIQNMFSLSRSMGHRVPEYFEWDGGYYRSVPLAEVMERQQPNAMSQASSAELRNAASVLRSQSGLVDAAVEQEIAKSGLSGSVMGPIIVMAANPPEQWLTSSPGGMMNLYATMLDAGAGAKDQMAIDKIKDRDEALENQELLDQVKSSMRIIGNSNVEGYPVIVLGADGLNMRQDVDGGTFITESVRLMIDVANHLPRQMRFEGTLKQGKDTQKMVIERTDSTFMGGDNCGDMLRPRQSVMRLKGAMSAAESAELEAARQQLANLPPDQLEMMKRMMGQQQFDMINNMAAGNGIEMVTDVLELRCNSDPPTAEEIAQKLN